MNLNNRFNQLLPPVQRFMQYKICKLNGFTHVKNSYFALNLRQRILIEVNMKLNRNFGIIAAIILSGHTLFAQDNDDWRIYNPSGKKSIQDSTSHDLQSHKQGEITIIADPRIKSLDLKKTEKPTKLNGYRVQIFFGDRSEAQEMRGEFIRKNPDVKAYISYLAPNFRLRVGDFRTRIECEKFKHEINRSFPGSYIVKDKIELPKLYDTESPEEN